jgi:diguanylate cyclase
LKQWVQKLIDQLDYDWVGTGGEKSKSKVKLSEDRATLLYVIDTYGKNLVDVDNHPVRKVRETLDGFTKELLVSDKDTDEDVLFRFRQFFASYKVAENAYLKKTFEDFKAIVWNFVEQMSDEANSEAHADKMVNSSLQQLREAVEADSMPLLRAKSREFIDAYTSQQSRKAERRTKRVRGIKKNLDLIKKQLAEADKTSKQDHLTGAFNRRSFDEATKQQIQIYNLSNASVSMIVMDIDFFKKINDTHGHDIGDFVLKECVRLLHETFNHEGDMVARIGGEEFAVILPNHAVEHAVKRAETAMARIRKEVFITGDKELRFTMSMGIAQLQDDESSDQWMKRADQALYESKHGGRNKFTLATSHAPRPAGSGSQVA